MKKRPNILFLMTDEQRYDVVGYAGNDIVRTPNIDKLAKDAVVFNNAYTPSPICIPARQAMMAGQLPKTCNCRRWAEDLEPNYMTFSRQLTMHGYQTVACGKLHHMGSDQMQGWQQRIAGDIHITNNYSNIVPGYEFTQKSQDGVGKRSDAQELIKAGIGDGTHTQKFDRRVLNGALDFIDSNFVDSSFDRPNPDQPLLLMVSMIRPHYPYLTTEEKINYYMNRVEIYDETEAFDHPFLSQRQVVPGLDASKREITRATAAYYGMIEEVDEDFGKVVDALEHVGQNLDEWVVVFTTDHGEMLGQHGIWEKQKFFEGSARVPLFIRYPEAFSPKSVEENVNLCDLFATICDLTHTPIPDGLDSRSLMGLMDDANTPHWDNESVSQFVIEQDGRDQNNVMIKRDHLKYQYYSNGLEDVLFDLNSDPEERVNVIGQKQYSKDVEAFRARVQELI